MKIWVTGGSGNLGLDLIKSLKLEFPDAEILAPNKSALDLLDSEKVANFVANFRPTYVFHLAACVYGIQGHKDLPDKSLIQNTLIDNNVFSALFDTPPHWVYYASTVAAYGYPFPNLPISEDYWDSGTPHVSEFGYAMAKRHAYSYLSLLKKVNETRFVYGLMTNLFGSGDRFLEGRGHVVVSLLEKAKLAKLNNELLYVWGNQNVTRDFLSTQMAASIILELIGKDVGALNIASGQEIAISRIAEEITHAFELEKGFRFTGENIGILNRVSDTTKLKMYSKNAKLVDSWGELSELIKVISQTPY
jgi:GDP-L-fucose synthase